MGKKSKIILFSVIGVVVVAAIAITLYFVLRNPMSLSESRMIKDLQNDKGLSSQKISGLKLIVLTMTKTKQIQVMRNFL